jgi:hypothetical protein
MLGNCSANRHEHNNWTATEERCFLRSPCQDVIRRTSGHPKEKANTTTDCLENQFISHDLCEIPNYTFIGLTTSWEEKAFAITM